MQVQAGRLFDPIVGRSTQSVVVDIEGRHVRALEANGSKSAPAAIDLRDFYVLPGLIDAHTHLAFDSARVDPVAALADVSDADLLNLMRARARAAARQGVTTLRDLGDRSFLAARLRDECRIDTTLPQILTSGPPVTSVGGHCAFFGGEIADPNSGKEAIRHLSERGVDVVKIMVTGGILTKQSDPSGIQFPVDTLVSLSKFAQSLGLPLAYHCHSSKAIDLSARLGGGTLEHCTFVDLEEETLRDAAIEALVPISPVVSPTLVERSGVDWDPGFLEWRSSGVRKMIRAGITVLAGTDAGVVRGLDHDSLPWAISSLTGAGMTPSSAIRAATILPALAFGLSRTKGSLRAGCDADLVAYSADPTVDVEVLTEPTFVMVRGVVVMDER